MIQQSDHYVCKSNEYIGFQKLVRIYPAPKHTCTSLCFIVAMYIFGIPINVRKENLEIFVYLQIYSNEPNEQWWTKIILSEKF